MVICPGCRAVNRDNARFCSDCGAQLMQSGAIGKTLGSQYRVVAVVKPGGMGTVYRAESAGRLYAVKEMSDNFANPDDRQEAINRFMAEALTLARGSAILASR